MTSSWAASALDWWQEAGVDMIVGETPRDWLNPKAKAAPAEVAPPPAALPDTLDAFRDWLAGSADLRSFLEDADRKLAARGLGELLQPDRGGKARGAGADDDHVIGHRLPISHSPSPPLQSSQSANDPADKQHKYD